MHGGGLFGFVCFLKVAITMQAQQQQWLLL
jgi:hypothetical protein